MDKCAGMCRTRQRKKKKREKKRRTVSRHTEAEILIRVEGCDV